MQKRNDKLGLVILHYLVIEETKNCVQSILELCDAEDYEIVIVDNASPNNTGKELYNLYYDNDNIHVILNPENMGFSKGNNVGFRYAKEELKCNFIVVCNNDILLRKTDFFKTVIKKYKETGAAVIGPRIYTYEDKEGHQNPMTDGGKDKEKVLSALGKKQVDLKIGIVLSYINLDKLFYSTKHRAGKLVHKEKPVDDAYFLSDHSNVQLHGSFWVFTPAYVEKFEGLEEVTFMYHEETILYLIMKKENQVMLYTPDLEIFHAEKRATQSVKRTKAASRRVRYERELLSTEKTIAWLKKQ